MTGRVVTFRLGGNLFGLDIFSILEVVRKVSYTPVPGTKPYIAGLMNMRGQVVTLFDLSKIMGYEQDTPGRSCIVLKTNHERPDYAGFLVEKPGNVIDVRDELCELYPEGPEDIRVKFIKELVKLEDGLVIIIEPAQIISECLTE